MNSIPIFTTYFDTLVILRTEALSMEVATYWTMYSTQHTLHTALLIRTLHDSTVTAWTHVKLKDLLVKTAQTRDSKHILSSRMATPRALLVAKVDVVSGALNSCQSLLIAVLFQCCQRLLISARTWTHFSRSKDVGLSRIWTSKLGLAKKSE